MQRPQAEPLGLVTRYLVHRSTSGFHMSYPLNGALSPNEMALHGHSRAHL